MLFVLEESLLEPLRARHLPTLVGLENLLVGVYNGLHCLSVAPALAVSVIGQGVLSERAAAAINAAAKSYAQREGTWRTMRSKLYIGGQQAPVRLSEWSWRYPADAFHYRSAGRTILLAENLTDARVYFHTARHYAVQKKLTPLATEIAVKGGGGSTTPDELEAIVSRGSEFCLSVTDSDVDYPGGTDKHAARRCAAIAMGTNWIVSHVTLRVRELENLFPVRLLDAALDPGMANRIEELFRLCDTEPSLVLHTDLKDGVPLGAVRNLAAGQPRQEYWTNVVERIRAIDGARAECKAEAECNSAAQCECELLPGLGVGICSQVLDWLQERSDHASLKEFSGSITLEEWSRVGQAVFEAGCATSPLRL